MRCYDIVVDSIGSLVLPCFINHNCFAIGFDCPFLHCFHRNLFDIAFHVQNIFVKRDFMHFQDFRYSDFSAANETSSVAERMKGL